LKEEKMGPANVTAHTAGGGIKGRKKGKVQKVSEIFQVAGKIHIYDLRKGKRWR